MRFYVILTLVVMVAFIPNLIFAQNTDPVVQSNVGAEYKFDDGFYQKIQNMIKKDLKQDGVYGASADPTHYSVILVVSRADGRVAGDVAAEENKDTLIEHLELIGAKNIYRAQSLSFVTAAIPIDKILEISLHDEVFKLGDGELPVIPHVDKARTTIKATTADFNQLNRTVNGSGIVVAIVDTGINSIYLNDMVRDRIYCPGGTCWTNNGLIMGNITLPSVGNLNTTSATHGTQVAQVIGASGMSNHNGIAPGVTLLDAMVFYNSKQGLILTNYTFSDSLAISLDWAKTQNADIANLSVGGIRACGNYTSSQSLDLIVNEAVDKGMILVNAAGNESFLTRFNWPDDWRNNRSYNTVVDPACAYNTITVGGIYDRTNPISMAHFSSRGPSNDNAPVLKPEIVAPAADIHVLHFTISDTVVVSGGTSFAAPQVSGVAALMLETEPELSPTEVKALLLLGANWTAPIPCTSAQFELKHDEDNCSFARQPSDVHTANNAASLNILNNVGFGILDAVQTLKYVQSSESHMISDSFDTNAPPKHYEFNVTDTTKPVKVIMSWLVHPHGDILDQINKTDVTPFVNLDFVVKCGTNTYYANSERQINEFVVFKPHQTGRCTITVTDHVSHNNNTYTQNYTLASTRPLQPFTPIVPISLELPDDFPDSVKTQPFTITPLGTDLGARINADGRYTNYGNGMIDIYFSEPTKILPNTTFESKGCETSVNLRDVSSNQGISLPNNTRSIMAQAMIFESDDTFNSKCPTNTTRYAAPLLLDKKVYITFNDITSKNVFYYSPLEDIDTALVVPLCTTANMYNNQTLKDNTEMCYGTLNNNTVIVSKRLAYFGAADTITPILPIKLPDSLSIPDTNKTIDLYVSSRNILIDGRYNSTINTIRIDTYHTGVGTKYYLDGTTDITIFRDTEITNKQFTGTYQDSYCYVGDLSVGQDSDVPVPHTNTLQLEFRQSSVPTRCNQSPVITFDNKLELSQEVYVRFADSIDKIPFYYIDNNTINIQNCTPANFDQTSSTILGDTEICYGKDGNDIILVSKILATFGVADIPTLKISLPNSMSINNTDRTIDLYAGTDNRIRIDTHYANTGTKYYLDNKADITIFRGTEIINKQFNSTSQDPYCYVGDLLVGQDSTISKVHINTLKISFRDADDPTRCDNAPEITFDNKLELSQEVYVRFAGTDGQNPFYHIGDDTIKIPKCTDDNFDETSSTLLGDTEICYGKNNNDTILVSKILAVFGTTVEDLS